MGGAEGVLKVDIPLELLREGLLGSHDVVEVGGEEEVGKAVGRNFSVHVPRPDEKAEFSVVPRREPTIEVGTLLRLGSQDGDAGVRPSVRHVEQGG